MRIQFWVSNFVLENLDSWRGEKFPNAASSLFLLPEWILQIGTENKREKSDWGGGNKGDQDLACKQDVSCQKSKVLCLHRAEHFCLSSTLSLTPNSKKTSNSFNLTNLCKEFGTYCDIGMNNVSLSIFTNKSTGNLIDWCREHLKTFVFPRESSLQELYVLFQPCKTSHAATSTA